MAKISFSWGRFLSKDTFNLKKIVLILSSISLIMYILIGSLGKIHLNNSLPFGFRYEVVTTIKTMSGKVPHLKTNFCQKHIFDKLSNSETIKSLTFTTFVYSSSKWYYRFHLPKAQEMLFICNDKLVKIKPYGLGGRILLNKGFNKIKIKYSHEIGIPTEFNFFLRFFLKKAHERRFVSVRSMPFYHFLSPGSSHSKLFHYFIRILDHIKSLGFILSLIVILLFLPRILSKKEKINIIFKKKHTLCFLLFEYSCFSLAMMFSIIFLNNRFHLKLPVFFIWSISLLIPLLNLIKFLRNKISIKINFKKILVLFLISILVFGYLYIKSGKVFPMEPVSKGGKGDLPSHMKMVHHYKQYNEVKTDYHSIVYPQSLHAFISILSDLFNTQPEKLITLFLAIILIMVYFLVYLLIKHSFPDISPIPFFLILILGNFTFVFNTIFIAFFFPPLVSIFFFLSALFFFFNNRLVVSSLLFAVSLIVYPWFVIIFSLILFLLFLHRLFNLEIKISAKILQFFLYFSFPILFSVIYILIYITHGFEQHQEGFLSFFKLSPISALKPFNTFLILMGISYLFSNLQKNKNIFLLVSGSIFGFFIYYIPYFLLDIGSTYYNLKNIFFLVFIGIILETYALHNIYFWLRETKWFKFLIKKRSVSD